MWMSVACLLFAITNSEASGAQQALDLDLSLFSLTLTVFDLENSVREQRSAGQSRPIVFLFHNVCRQSGGGGWVRPHLQHAAGSQLPMPTKHHPAQPLPARATKIPLIIQVHNQPNSSVRHPSSSVSPAPTPDPNQASTAPTHGNSWVLHAAPLQAPKPHTTPPHTQPQGHTRVHGACRCPKKYSTLLQHPSATQPQAAVVFGILCVCVCCVC